MRALALPLLLAGACLSTPSPAAPDAEPPGPPDAMDPCPADDCTQLLAIGMAGYDVLPDNGPGWLILSRDPGDDDWTRVADSDGPEWNVNDLDWGDCCGPGGGPDGLPDLLAASWYGPFVQQLDLVDGAVVVRPYVDLEEFDGADDEEAQAEFVDLDADLDLDVITGQPDLHVYRNDAPGWTLETPIEDATRRVAVGNWDDDPAPEMAVIDPRPQPDGGLGVRVREDDGSWVPVDDTPLSNAIWCDVTGGPEPDLMVSSADAMVVYPNRGSAVGGNWLDLDGRIDLGPSGVTDPALVCGDVDRDGDTDLLLVTVLGVKVLPHGATSYLPVWSPQDIGRSDLVEGIELGDVDDDGYPELFVAVPNAEYDVVGPVVYVLPNRIGIEGGFGFGEPEVLHAERTAALAVAFVELAPR